MTPTTPQPAPRINLTIPLVALVLSFATTAGGSWITLQINSATIRAHMEASDKRIDVNTADIKELVPKEQFATALNDLKEQMVEMKLDLKEIRRAVVAPR